MRLPGDTDEAVALIRHAIDAGMRYIDTSRGYGDSEIKIGKALKNGYRQKVILSTKWSPWVTKIEESDNTSADCVRKRIEESMTRLDVDYLDYYQVWNVDSREHYDQAVAKGGMVDGIKNAIGGKLVGHTGFTTHDKVENIIEYVKETDWCEIILFSFNILNATYEKAIEAAHAKGIGTIIMNPVAGGMLGHDSPVLMDLAGKVGAKSIPELAIRVLTSNPNVTTVISGISKTADVDSTVAAVKRGHFTAGQMDLIRKSIAEIQASNKGFCTGCRYCMPCSQEIDIPAVMSMIAQYRFWGFHEPARAWYRDHKGPKAEACIHCGKCEEKCTQHLHIMDEMEYAIRNLASA
jgi:predicted aldo/keto reductase-like oxidoreductase